MKSHFGSLDEKALQQLREAYDQNANSFAESCEELYDFKTCQRSDGTTYGTSGDCTQLGSKEVKKGSTSKKVSAKAKSTADAFSIDKVRAKSGPELAKTAFGFGNFIKAVGGAAGVAPITDIIGGAVHETEVKRTNRMLQDNAAKAQKAARTAEAAAMNPEIKDYQEAMKSTTDPAEKAMIGEMIDEMVEETFAAKARAEAEAAAAAQAKAVAEAKARAADRAANPQKYPDRSGQGFQDQIMGAMNDVLGPDLMGAMQSNSASQARFPDGSFRTAAQNGTYVKRFNSYEAAIQDANSGFGARQIQRPSSGMMSGPPGNLQGSREIIRGRR